MLKEPIKATIYCIIEDNGQVLLTEDEGKPGWKLPGGEVEKGEVARAWPLLTAVSQATADAAVDTSGYDFGHDSILPF